MVIIMNKLTEWISTLEKLVEIFLLHFRQRPDIISRLEENVKLF